MPLIPTTQPATSVMFESKMPPIPPLAAANEPPSTSLLGPAISETVSSLPSVVPSLDPLPSSSIDSSLLGIGLDYHPH